MLGLQEVNDPKHKSKLCCQWKHDHGITVLPWPACSPDLNPIENVWALLKHKVEAHKATTLKGLVRAINQEWHALP